MTRVPCALALAAAACGGGHSAPRPDAARCAAGGPFGAGMPVGGLASAADEVAARLSPDELTIVFARGTSPESFDLYTATRSSATAPFDLPAVVTSASSVYADTWPTLSPDQRVLLFDSDRRNGQLHVFATHRASPADAFAPPAAALSLADGEDHPMLANGSAVYFASATRTGGLGMHDLWRADVDGSGTVGTPAAVPGDVNTPDDEDEPVVTPDELTVFFVRTTAAGSGIYTATRASASAPFATPTPVTGLVPDGTSAVPDWISPDGCALYFHSNAAGGAGGQDLYVAVRGG